LYGAYREKGDAGLLHGNDGKPSNNRTDEAILTKAIEYHDFGPMCAAET